MKAGETTLQPIVEGTKQYLVPLFQRSYSWDKKQWGVLWDDLLELAESEPGRRHFIGSIVTMQTASVPEGIPKFLLIDGQQRLTTIFVLLTLLRDNARQRGEEPLADEIDKTLLVNPFKKGHEHYKLLPTQSDRASFTCLIRGDGGIPNDRIGKAYQYFQKRTGQSSVSEELLKKIVTERLSVVSITLDQDDNPYLVFESLNAKGEPLTQSDLIRNFFFLRIHSDQHDEIHEKHWRPMQEALGDDLTEFVRHFLMRDGAIVRTDSVYYTLKERLGTSDALAMLRTLQRSAESYRKLLDPKQETDEALRVALGRLNRLEVTTAYPFLLQCYDALGTGQITKAEFAEIVRTLENFVVRRFICGVPTNQFNKIFAPLYNQAKGAAPTRLVDAVKRILSTRGYPKDAEFRDRLRDARLYGGGDRVAKTKLILESLDEMVGGGKETVAYGNLNIEHVMPQGLTDWWRGHLGDGAETVYELYLHTLGNLTLTGYNPELSNSSFPDKRKLMREKSVVPLNKYFDQIDSWRIEDIERRADVLADAALMVWPYFGTEGPEERKTATTGDKPTRLSVLGRSVPVGSWRDVLEETLKAVAERDEELLPRIEGELPRLLSRSEAAFNYKRPLVNGYYFNVNNSADTTRRYCHRVLAIAEVGPEEWTVGTGDS